jgi:phosphomannomutase/phosphoglucomutase
MTEGENFAFIEQFKKVARFDGANISTIDGIRADFQDGWGLVRCSNTTPILVVRFDGESEEALERIKTSFRSQMLAVKPDLELPF